MSCKKNTIVTEPVNNSSNTTPNWNTQYIGNYKGTWTSSAYGSQGNGPLYSKDTTIIIGASTSDSSLTTSLSNCSIIYYDSSVNSFPIYHGRIDFRNDSMYYACGHGGLGGGYNETFKGKKL
jgi:hypothetical protein